MVVILLFGAVDHVDLLQVGTRKAGDIVSNLLPVFLSRALVVVCTRSRKVGEAAVIGGVQQHLVKVKGVVIPFSFLLGFDDDAAPFTCDTNVFRRADFFAQEFRY